MDEMVEKFMKKIKANEEEKRHPNRVSHDVYVGPLKYFQESIENLEVLRGFPAVFKTLSEAHL